MGKLIQTELMKQRRKRLPGFMLLAALVMPLFSLIYFTGVDRTCVGAMDFYKWTAFSMTPWIILPVALGVLCTMLMYDEIQHDTCKQLWIVPVSRMGYFFSKFTVVLLFSVCFMMITAVVSAALGVISGYAVFSWQNIGYLFRKCMEIAVLTAAAVMPLLAAATAAKGYVFPVCLTLVYTFTGFVLLMVNMYLHPLSAMFALVMRDISGVVLTQALNLPAAVVCIAVWDMISVIFACVMMKKV